MSKVRSRVVFGSPSSFWFDKFRKTKFHYKPKDRDDRITGPHPKQCHACGSLNTEIVSLTRPKGRPNRTYKLCKTCNHKVRK